MHRKKKKKREKSKGDVLLVNIHPACNNINTQSDLKRMALRHNPALLVTCNVSLSMGDTWCHVAAAAPCKNLSGTVSHSLSLLIPCSVPHPGPQSTPSFLKRGSIHESRARLTSSGAYLFCGRRMQVRKQHKHPACECKVFRSKRMPEI